MNAKQSGKNFSRRHIEILKYFSFIIIIITIIVVFFFFFQKKRFDILCKLSPAGKKDNKIAPIVIC